MASLSLISRIKTVWLIAVALFLSSFLTAFEVRAQSNVLLDKVQSKQDESAKSDSLNRDVPVGELLAAVKGRLAEARKQFSGIDNQAQRTASATQEETDEYKNLRERLIYLYELQVRALEQKQIIDAAADKLRQQMASWTGFDEPRPYPIYFSDELWREIKNQE